MRIANSLHIGEIMLSEAYYPEVAEGQYHGVEALDLPQELEFDGHGNLVTPIK